MVANTYTIATAPLARASRTPKTPDGCERADEEQVVDDEIAQR